MRNGKLLTPSLLLSEHSCKQSVEFFVGKLLDGVGRICGQDMPTDGDDGEFTDADEVSRVSRADANENRSGMDDRIGAAVIR
jgi:hypothetical protein